MTDLNPIFHKLQVVRGELQILRMRENQLTDELTQVQAQIEKRKETLRQINDEVDRATR